MARALRELCNIPYKSFFLAAHMGEGDFAYFTGPHIDSDAEIHTVFRRDRYLQMMNRAASSEPATTLLVHRLPLTRTKESPLRAPLTRIMT